MKSVCTSLLALASASFVTGQSVDNFYPVGAESYYTSELGDILPATHVIAHLAQINATLPYCSGANDVLALTFAAPILHDMRPCQFAVSTCPIRSPPADNATSVVVGCAGGSVVDAECAVLQPADEPNERRTV